MSSTSPRDDATYPDSFHPAVARWFGAAFPSPSPVQSLAWPAISRGESCLLLAPTGSGKTLAAFLCAIDALCRQASDGALPEGIQVLYITPLKALGNDIRKNLLEPLAGIRAQAGTGLPEIRVAVRTGDTPQAERQRMARTPPHILITTPESLFLLLQSTRMVPALRGVRTVIVDEIHSLCGSKRGAHLSISLERLQHLVEGPLQRVGCSATIRPLEQVAAFLTGFADGEPRPCTIIDAGMRKNLDIRVMAPLRDFLEASNTALWSSAYELLLDEIRHHTTTLIFANSRYKTERTVLRLSELAGPGARIGAHHGSMSMETRLETEDALKSGELDALVATSSLELGIDIGSVDIVYQLESPKSVASGLQRVGRAGHLLDAVSQGRMLIFERDELFEAAAICRSMLDGLVDPLHIPRGCLDVLAQQIAGSVAAGLHDVDELFTLLRGAYSFTALPRAQFEAVLGMLAGEHAFQMAHAPRPLLLWDRSASRLSPTRDCAHVCAMCVGMIPETTDYEVVIASNNKRVGTIGAEFVDDNLRNGDVFVLGSTAWRMVGVRRNRLLVEEAPAATPTVPWWIGAVESRSFDVGARVGALRRAVAERLHDDALPAWLQQEYCLCPHAANALIDYVREQQTVAGMVPDEQHLLVESWRDELGRLNIIIHSPFGARIHKTWGLALTVLAKRRFRQDWNATATNDILLLTRREGPLPPVTPMDASTLFAALAHESADELVTCGALDIADAESSFRDVAVGALQVLRGWQGKRIPPWLRNLRATELHEAARAYPDYPVITEVRREYLADVLDITGLEQMLARVADRQMHIVFRDVESPSPFAHSILIADKYSSDHQMGRDRRAHLLRMHRQVLQEVLSTEQMAQLLDPRAIERLEARWQHQAESTRAGDADELAQVLRDIGDLPAELSALQDVTTANPASLLASLVASRRVVALRLPNCEMDPIRLVSADIWQEYHDAFGNPAARPTVLVPRVDDGALEGFSEVDTDEVIPAAARTPQSREAARKAIIARYLCCRGPITQYEVMNQTGWPIGAVESILDALCAEGTVARGVYSREKPAPQWVNKANLEEIHRQTMGYLKHELAACEAYEVVDYLTRWQHVHPSTRLMGVDGLRTVLRQLQGLEVLQGFLETDLLPARVSDYAPEMLDQLIAGGEVCWRRVSHSHLRRGMMTLCFRTDTEWLSHGAPLSFDVVQESDVDIAEQIPLVRQFFREYGSGYFDDMLRASGVEEGAALRAVWYLAWSGELYCESYACLRHAGFTTTLSGCYDLMNTPRKILWGRDSAARVLERMKRRRLDPRLGRWTATERLRPPLQPLPTIDIVRRWARQLLTRWGIVSREMLANESAAPPWSALALEFKRLELLGQVQRGYFIANFQGEQYGLPEAIELLRDCRARRSEQSARGYLDDEPIFSLISPDPANLYASCLEIVEERGGTFYRKVKSGMALHRMALQAGQVLLFLSNGVMQLATLTRAQIAECIEQLRQPITRHGGKLEIQHWNGHPIAGHAIAGLLQEMGFRYAKDCLCWPQAAKSITLDPPEPTGAIFPPYYDDTAVTVSYSAAWLLEHRGEAIRAPLERIFAWLIPELERRAWQMGWSHYGGQAAYHGVATAELWVMKSFVTIIIRMRALRGADGEKTRFRYQRRICRLEDITQELCGDLLNALDTVQLMVQQWENNHPDTVWRSEE